ncbi:hypothetical protein Pmani_035219 [Petrolisthes manimaculis]|uniref:Uncharacterized protein n=1 Tax=Petrolisthes manimaculis TaxID=1843537 RepID=A0AAE1NM56_9EUCA|nr:hypothetical protein Pmani_035219 [Petrolisthes manimaculis]
MKRGVVERGQNGTGMKIGVVGRVTEMGTGMRIGVVVEGDKRWGQMRIGVERVTDWDRYEDRCGGEGTEWDRDEDRCGGDKGEGCGVLRRQEDMGRGMMEVMMEEDDGNEGMVTLVVEGSFV